MSILVGNKSEEVPANALEALRGLTKIVADSADFRCFDKYWPVDATTNPSLILAAVELGTYNDVVNAAVRNTIKRCPEIEDVEEIIGSLCEELLVEFGCRMAENIPGLVSVEVDPSLTYDIDGSIAKARGLVKMFESRGINRSRIAFKLASVWEGFEAAKVLEKEGIQCNMTLMFSLCQAIAAAQAGATLVSPYVGRILEWHKKNGPAGVVYSEENDPGVIGVKRIFKYYKQHGCQSLIMGASFRNIGEILSLAGCDNLTIAPKWLEELKKLPASAVTRSIDIADPLFLQGLDKEITYGESDFKWAFNQDRCAVEQLSNGLRLFDADWTKLKGILRQHYLEQKSS